VTADGGTSPKVREGWMWDLTVPGNNDHDFYVIPAPTLRSSRVESTVAVLVHNSNCGVTRFSVDSAGTVTDSQGPAGILLNKASGDGFRDTVASFLRSQGRTVTTDAENRSALTFQALGKPRILDMMVQNDSGDIMGYVETKYGGAAARYEGSFQQQQDEWLRQNMGLTIDVVSGG
jgi:hypothetical protein